MIQTLRLGKNQPVLEMSAALRLTIHYSNNTVATTLSIDIVVTQLTSCPAYIATLASNLTFYITRVKSVRHVVEGVFERSNKSFGCSFGIRITLFHGEVELREC